MFLSFMNLYYLCSKLQELGSLGVALHFAEAIFGGKVFRVYVLDLLSADKDSEK